MTAVLLQQRWTQSGRHLRQRGPGLLDDDVRQRVQPEGSQRQGEERRVVVGRYAHRDVRCRRSRLRVGSADRSPSDRERAQAVLIHRRRALARRQDHVRRRHRPHAQRDFRLAGRFVDGLARGGHGFAHPVTLRRAWLVLKWMTV